MMMFIYTTRTAQLVPSGGDARVPNRSASVDSKGLC